MTAIGAFAGPAKVCPDFLRVAVNNDARFEMPPVRLWIEKSVTDKVFQAIVRARSGEMIPFFTASIDPLIFRGGVYDKIGIFLMTASTHGSQWAADRPVTSLLAETKPELILQVMLEEVPGAILSKNQDKYVNSKDVIVTRLRDNRIDQTSLKQLITEIAALFSHSPLGDLDRVSPWILSHNRAELRIRIDHLSHAEYTTLTNKIAERMFRR